MGRCWGADMDFGHSNLIYDRDEKIYQMWNQVVDHLWKESLLGYYTSVNGIDWEAPSVGQLEFRSPFCNLAKLRLDGFVSLTAGEAEFTTRPLVFDGERLEINMRSLLGDFVSMVRTGRRPVELMKDTVAVCRIMIGAGISRQAGGRRVKLEDELKL